MIFWAPYWLLSIFFRTFRPKTWAYRFRLLSIFLFCLSCWSFFLSICNNFTVTCLVMRWKVKRTLSVSLTSCLIFTLQTGGSQTIREKYHYLPKIYRQPKTRFFLNLYQIFLSFDYQLGHSISFLFRHLMARLLQKLQFFFWLIGPLFGVIFHLILLFTNFLRSFFLF